MLKKHWHRDYEPSKPREPSLKDEVYRNVSVDIKQFGRYEEIPMTDLLAVMGNWIKENSMEDKDAVFFCEIENDGGYGDDEMNYNLHLKVKYKLPLNSLEVSLAKKDNLHMKENYIREMNAYNLQMTDWNEIKKERKWERDKKELEQYLKLKEKFEKK